MYLTTDATVRNILIVDDSAFEQRLLADLLSEMPYRVSVAYNGAEGYRQALARHPDLILLDVRMPDMSGATLFDTLAARGLTRRIPVIFLTGHGDVPMAVEALKRGAFDFFEKPFSDNALVDRVIAALELAAARRLQDRTQAALADRLAELTQREREVMDRILAGKLNKVIADELQISMRTVEVHRARLFAKMGVRSAVELANLLR